jgi:D-alanine-D-alanine ligase
MKNTRINNTRVAVLMGGFSTERGVSLRSGAAVGRALEAARAAVTLVDVRGPDFQLPFETEVVFVALHGTFGEDGTVQQILEDCGVPYTGSDPEASAKAFDKVAAKAEFEDARIPTPRYKVVGAGRHDLKRLADMKLPLVVKPARQGSSVGVEIVHNRAELEKACVNAARYDERLVVEEFIPGRELTVGIVDGQPLPVIEIRPKQRFFTYQAKYTPGQTDYLVPAPVDTVTAARAQFLAQRAHDCLGCRDLSRVDLILGDSGEIFVLEVNTIPGFTDTSLVPKAARTAGISFQELCVQLVEMALARGGKAEVASREEDCPVAQFYRAAAGARER